MRKGWQAQMMNFLARKKSTAATERRIWQIDCLRGAAIVLMVFIHLLVDLRDFFGVSDIAYFEPPWYYVGKVSAILFMLVSGASCRLSKSNVRRGLAVFAAGMGITAATFAFEPTRDVYIRFGILHFLGASMIITGLAGKLIRTDRAKLIFWRAAAVLSLAVGYYFSGLVVSSPLLFPIGLVSADFRSYDYYPLFPWIGVFFAGVASGGVIVKNKARLLSCAQAPAFRPLCWLGRHSLAIYALHQPLLLILGFGILWLFA
jgi:uncharacterized membrane protein